MLPPVTQPIISQWALLELVMLNERREKRGVPLLVAKSVLEYQYQKKVGQNPRMTLFAAGVPTLMMV